MLKFIGLVNEKFGLDSSYEISQSLMFFFIVSVLDKVRSFPSSLYFSFLQQKHGFEEKTPTSIHIMVEVGFLLDMT
jgi:hypothetical protein